MTADELIESPIFKSYVETMKQQVASLTKERDKLIGEINETDDDLDAAIKALREAEARVESLTQENDTLKRQLDGFIADRIASEDLQEGK